MHMFSREKLRIEPELNVPSHLERDEHAEELPLVADEAAVADYGQLLHHLVLNQHRRDVLPAGGDDQLLGTGANGSVRHRHGTRTAPSDHRRLYFVNCSS